MTDDAMVGTSGAAPINPGNLVAPDILTGWMQSAIGTPVANFDQWCHIMHERFPAFQCPGECERMGLCEGEARLNVTATRFLDALRSYFDTQTTVPGVTTQHGMPTGEVNKGTVLAGTGIMSMNTVLIVLAVAAIGYYAWKEYGS